MGARDGRIVSVKQQQRLTQLRRLRRRPLKWQPLRYSRQRGPATRCAQTGRPLEAPLALRSSGDDSKAAPLRQPLLWRHSLARGVFSFPQLTKVLLAPAFGVAALPSESSPEERSAGGDVEGLPV